MSPAAPHAVGRIGPNAITRVAEVLHMRLGHAATSDLFEAAGLRHHLQVPPQDMVDETEVRRLHGLLRDRLGASTAKAVAQAAGRRTADYLLARRIPQPVQWLLKHLPAPLAARVLLSAIRRNAWTFVGSGHFCAEAVSRSDRSHRGNHGMEGDPQVRLHIRDNPLCAGLVTAEPACDFYASTYERLFQVLVHPRTQVREVACEACGDAECRFELSWQPR